MAKKKKAMKAKKTMAKKTMAKKSTKKVAKKATAKKMTVTMKAVAKKLGPVPPKKPVLSNPKNSRQYTQSEFFECIRGYCGFNNRREAKDFYGDFATMIQAALKSGYKLVLPGLGKMQVRKTKARMGRNPMTQEIIQIPAKRKVAFTANKALKEAVL